MKWMNIKYIKQLTTKQNNNLKSRLSAVLFVLIMVIGCVGSNQNINNNNEDKQSEKEPTRDRTPSVPRINVPTHTF